MKLGYSKWAADAGFPFNQSLGSLEGCTYLVVHWNISGDDRKRKVDCLFYFLDVGGQLPACM